MAKQVSGKKVPQLKEEAEDLSPENHLKRIDEKISEKLKELSTLFGGAKCIPLFMSDTSIGHSLVDDIFDDLRENHEDCLGKLLVIIESGGGDLDAAYNIGLLLRRYGKDELTFIVPRWAKSAATLLVCSGDCIYMTPIAELGPLDPQITEFNPMEGRLEQFSPLSIEATLELIREEYKNGNEKLADALMERLQFPLTLGGFKKSLENADQYLERLLSTRMFKNDTDENEKNHKIQTISKQLVKNYSHHGFCINCEEAQSIGLKTELLEGQKLDLVWEIHKLNKEKSEIIKNKKQKSIEGMLPDFLGNANVKDNKNTPDAVNNNVSLAN